MQAHNSAASSLPATVRLFLGQSLGAKAHWIAASTARLLLRIMCKEQIERPSVPLVQGRSAAADLLLIGTSELNLQIRSCLDPAPRGEAHLHDVDL